MASNTAGAIARERNGSERLIEAAETLFGRHGLDGVSMRQIQLAAGSSNKFAVQYHFGDLEGLAQAILAKRMPAVDVRQAELLARLEATDATTDVRELLDAFLRPLIEQRNANGDRAYARFISALLRSAAGERYCAALFHLTPTTGDILKLLRAALPAVPPAILSERLRLLTSMICTSVFNRVKAVDAETDARLIADALDMSAAAAAAPVANRITGAV